MGRNLDVANDGFKASGGLREDIGEEIFGARALDLRCDALAFGEAKQLQTASGGPTPTGFEDGRRDGGLFEQFLYGLLRKKLENVGERKTMLLGERNIDAIIGRGG